MGVNIPGGNFVCVCVGGGEGEFSSGEFDWWEFSGWEFSRGELS